MCKMTCAELTKLDFQNFSGITMWMSGYYNASIRSAVVELCEFGRGRQDGKGSLRDEPTRQGDVHC
jgi:hypothetical protein